MTCAKPAFNTLVDGLVVCRAERKICTQRADLAETELRLAQARIAELAAVDHCAACQKKTSAIKPVSGYVMGLLGVVSVAAALAFPLPEPARWSLGLAGVVAVGGGVVFVLP